MTDENYWLLMPITAKTTKAQLAECVRQMPSKYYRGHSHPSRKAELAEFIQDRRAIYWNDKQQEKSKPTYRFHADLCEITAAECNAWLKRLPETNEAAQGPACGREA